MADKKSTEITKIQLKTKISSTDNSEILLDRGEPLFVPDKKELRIGTSSDGTADNALVLSPTHLKVGNASSTENNECTDNGSVNIKLVDDNDFVHDSHIIKGSRAVKVTSDDSGNIDVDADFTLSHTVSDNSATITLTDAINGSSDTVTFVGSPNLSITADGTNIKLSGTSKVTVIEETTEPDKGPDEVLPHPDTAAPNDICIVKRYITTDPEKLSYTAYVYKADNGWEAMDGNYSAENVYLSEDMVITEDFGKYSKENYSDFEESGNYTVPTKSQSIQSVLFDAFSRENYGSVTNPSHSFTVSPTTPQYGEVGTQYNTPTATFKVISVGSYQYGPPTGIVYTVNLTGGGNSKTGQTLDANEETVSVQYGVNGTQTKATFTDESIDYKFTAQYEHTAGVKAKTNLDGDGAASSNYNILELAQQSQDKYSSDYIGYRKSFYKVSTDTFTLDDSEDGVNGNNWMSSSSKPSSIYVPAGTRKVSVAIPENKTLLVKDSLAMNAVVTFNDPSTLLVTHNSLGTVVTEYTYYVYEVDWGAGIDTAKELQLTWS